MPSLWDALRQYLRDAGPGGVLNPEVTPQGLLDTASLASAPVPIAGDIIGLLADANRMRDPSERTATNFGLMALGALPLVPSGLGKAKDGMKKAANAARYKAMKAFRSGGAFPLGMSAGLRESPTGGTIKILTDVPGARQANLSAHEIAQRNAAMPVENGGLGLPPNNTAMDRARAMGFDTHGWRGSTADETSSRGPRWWSEDRDYANAYAARIVRPPPGQPDDFAGNVMPLLVNTRAEKPFTKVNFAGVPSEPLQWGDTQTWARRYGENAGDLSGRVWEGLTVPQNVRSRFAAFDPMKRDSSDLLASIAPYAITGGLLGLLGLPDDAQAGK